MKAWFLELVLSVGTGSDMQYLAIQMPSKAACEFSRDEAVIATTMVETPAHTGGGVETMQHVSLSTCFRASVEAVERWRPGDPKLAIDEIEPSEATRLLGENR